jgi:hypothetical protein
MEMNQLSARKRFETHFGSFQGSSVGRSLLLFQNLATNIMAPITGTNQINSNQNTFSPPVSLSLKASIANAVSNKRAMEKKMTISTVSFNVKAMSLDF